tara:strand:- start:748 stop:912 length:165 start_codon:yes stop_codon:yes gene_type:complete
LNDAPSLGKFSFVAESNVDGADMGYIVFDQGIKEELKIIGYFYDWKLYDEEWIN